MCFRWFYIYNYEYEDAFRGGIKSTRGANIVPSWMRYCAFRTRTTHICQNDAVRVDFPFLFCSVLLFQLNCFLLLLRTLIAIEKWSIDEDRLLGYSVSSFDVNYLWYI